MEQMYGNIQFLYDGQHIQIIIDMNSSAIHASNYRQYDGQLIQIIIDMNSSAIHASNYIQIIYLSKSIYRLSFGEYFLNNCIKKKNIKHY